MSGDSSYPLIAIVVFLIGLFIIAITIGLINRNNPQSDYECESNKDCKDGKTCYQNNCKLENGLSCNRNSECVSNYCDKTCKNNPPPLAPAPYTNPQQNNYTVSQPPQIYTNPKEPQVTFTTTIIPPMTESSPSQELSDTPYAKTTPYVKSTPYKENNSEMSIPSEYDGNYQIISHKDVIGLARYGNSDILLTTSGILKDDKFVYTNLKSQITSIAPYDGYLLVVSDAIIYLLLTETFDTISWTFVDASTRIDIPTTLGAVLRISSTLNSDCLNIQTYNTNYSFSQGVIINQEYNESHIVRRLGKDSRNYVDIDTIQSTCTVYLYDREPMRYQYIYDCVLDYNSNPHFLTIDRASSYNLIGIYINSKWRVVTSQRS